MSDQAEFDPQAELELLDGQIRRLQEEIRNIYERRGDQSDSPGDLVDNAQSENVAVEEETTLEVLMSRRAELRRLVGDKRGEGS